MKNISPFRYSLIKQESTGEDREPPSLDVSAFNIALKANVDKTPGTTNESI